MASNAVAARMVRSALIGLNCTTNDAPLSLPGAPIALIFPGLAIEGTGGGIGSLFSPGAFALGIGDASSEQATVPFPVIVGPRFGFVGFANVTPPVPPPP